MHFWGLLNQVNAKTNLRSSRVLVTASVQGRCTGDESIWAGRSVPHEQMTRRSNHLEGLPECELGMRELGLGTQ